MNIEECPVHQCSTEKEANEQKSRWKPSEIAFQSLPILITGSRSSDYRSKFVLFELIIILVWNLYSPFATVNIWRKWFELSVG